MPLSERICGVGDASTLAELTKFKQKSEMARYIQTANLSVWLLQRWCDF